MGQYIFGIDIGGTTVKHGLFDTEGNLLDKWEIVTRTENGGEAILPDIAASVEAKMQEKGITKDQVAGVGMGVPAPVTPDGVVKMTANLGWGYKEVRREFAELSGMKVSVGNDANVAALGESWRGGAEGYNNVVLLTLGTGVGGGVIINGRIVGGANGVGGEIGHIHVDDTETEACGCGHIGCLEQMVSATGIVRICKKMLAATEETTVLRDCELSAKAIFDAVKEGDAFAVSVAEVFGRYLGQALANISMLLDPEVFVIGGGVSKAGSVLIEYARKYYLPMVFPQCYETKIVLAKLANDAGIYGAARMVLE